MSPVTAPGEKTPCVLEMAEVSAAPRAGSSPESRPCALLCADVPADSASTPAAPSPPAAPAPARAPSAPPEDESADPVGDGHSDAEWAERHPQDR